MLFVASWAATTTFGAKKKKTIDQSKLGNLTKQNKMNSIEDFATGIQ